jgi:hypothetical protein
MADLAKFEIFTFQRKPGQWRASITRKDQRPGRTSAASGEEILSIVTPVDCASEDAAARVATEVVKKL